MSGLAGQSSKFFEPDGFGSLRDIDVLDTDAQDWQRVLDFLRSRSGRFSLVFSVDGVPRDLPPSAAEIFSVWERAAPALFIDLRGVHVAGYFFDNSTIEFDVDPRDVLRPERADLVVGFMQDLADLLGKPVILTPDNDLQNSLVRREPVGQAEQ